MISVPVRSGIMLGLCCALSVVCLCAQMSPEERVELCTRLKGINFWGCISHTSIEAACVPVAGVGVGVGVGAGKDVHTHTLSCNTGSLCARGSYKDVVFSRRLKCPGARSSCVSVMACAFWTVCSLFVPTVFLVLLLLGSQVPKSRGA